MVGERHVVGVEEDARRRLGHHRARLARERATHVRFRRSTAEHLEAAQADGLARREPHELEALALREREDALIVGGPEHEGRRVEGAIEELDALALLLDGRELVAHRELDQALVGGLEGEGHHAVRFAAGAPDGQVPDVIVERAGDVQARLELLAEERALQVLERSGTAQSSSPSQPTQSRRACCRGS